VRVLRGDLDAVLDRALQPAVAARYAGADDLAADLRAWLAGEAVSARPRSRIEQLRHWAVRHKAAVASAAVVAVTLVASAAVSTWQALLAREQAAHAAAEAERAHKEAARAQATQAMLKRIFQLNSMDQPDPLRAQRTTVRELLDLTARSAGEVMKDTPDAHIDLLETLAALYAQLGASGPAAELARRRVELVRQALPDDDPRRADALLSLAGRLHDTPERATARALIDEAEAVMQRAGTAADALQGVLVLQKARHERWGRLQDGLAHAEQAVAWFRRPDADQGLRVSALYFASVINDMTGDPARGLQHLQEAREIALARGDAQGALARLDALPRSPGLTAHAVDPHAVKAQVLRAAALRSLGRPHEAVAVARQATAELGRLPAPVRWPALEAEAALALGLALREPGQRAEATGALRHAAAVRRAFDLPGSLWRARAEAALQGRTP
jgi:serine/threonine-protein kinase